MSKRFVGLKWAKPSGAKLEIEVPAAIWGPVQERVIGSFGVAAIIALANPDAAEERFGRIMDDCKGLIDELLATGEPYEPTPGPTT